MSEERIRGIADGNFSLDPRVEAFSCGSFPSEGRGEGNSLRREPKKFSCKKLKENEHSIGISPESLDEGAKDTISKLEREREWTLL